MKFKLIVDYDNPFVEEVDSKEELFRSMQNLKDEITEELCTEEVMILEKGKDRTVELIEEYEAWNEVDEDVEAMCDCCVHDNSGDGGLEE